MRRQPAVVRHLQEFLHRHGLSAAGLVVAVSGGPDSVALLRAWVALRANHAGPPPPLIVAHLNHQLRPEESDTDEAFVRQLWAELHAAGAANLVYRSERIPVAELARQTGDNLEQVARNTRYDWLLQVARASGLGQIATGHTADDQAETVLHRLLRGSGLQGLRGIAACREMAPGIRLIRPLLRTTRAEVLAYLEALGQDYRVDRTNLDWTFTRNRIRHELLPLLAEHYNPATTAVLCRLAEQAHEVYDFVEGQARALLAVAERPRAGAVLVFDRPTLAASHVYLIREVFRLVWTREGWPMGAMTFDHWDRLAHLATTASGNVQLPGGLRAQARARVVQVGLSEKGSDPLNSKGSDPFSDRL